VKPYVVKSDNVGMRQRGGQSCLALNPLEKRSVAGEFFGHDLDGHVAPQPRVLGPVHLGHPPRP
jgi:hypothetical protein